MNPRNVSASGSRGSVCMATARASANLLLPYHSLAPGYRAWLGSAAATRLLYERPNTPDLPALPDGTNSPRLLLHLHFE
jgi:hypothetical protein